VKGVQILLVLDDLFSGPDSGTIISTQAAGLANT